MGIEINLDKLKKLNFQMESTEKAVTSAPSECIEIGTELGGVTEGYSDKTVFSKKESGKPESKEQDIANKIVSELRTNSEFRLAGLKDFLNKNISDSELRAEADKCIEKIEKMDSEKYIKEYKKEKDGSLYKGILEVYINEKKTEALIDFGKFFARASKKGSNYTDIINAYKAGWTIDEDGNMKNNGKISTYQEYALNTYTTLQMPNEMEILYQKGIKALEKEGTLQNYKTENELAKAVAEKVGINGTDLKFETYVKGKKTITKLVERHDKIMKRREELKHVSKEEIEKKLNKKTIASIKSYMEDHKNDDGTYDLSGISVVLEKRVGKDYLVNRYDDKNKERSEREGSRRELVKPRENSQGNNDTIVKNPAGFDPADYSSYNQTDDLLHFCEYPFEPKNHVPSIIDSIIDLVECASAGFLAHIGAPQLNNLYITQEVVLKEILNYIPASQFGDIISTGENAAISIQGLSVTIIQSTEEHLLWDNILPAVGIGCLVSIATKIVSEAIFGREIPCEPECFDITDFDKNDPTFNNKANYIEYLKAIGKYDNKIKSKLENYPVSEGKSEDETNNWNYEDFLNDMRTDEAGQGSNRNCLEAAGAEMYPDVKPVEQKPFQPQAVVFSKIVEEQESEENYQKRVKQSQDNYRIMNTNDSDWDTILGLYPCLEEVMGSRKNAVRAIAIIQGIEDDEKFDFNDAKKIRHIVDLSFEYQNTKNKARLAEIEAELEQIPGYKWEKAWNHWKHYQVNRNLPKSIAGCEGPEVLTQQRLKAKEKATELVNKAEAQKHFDDPSVRTAPIERRTSSSSQAFGKFTTDGKQVTMIGGETEEIVRENLKIMSGLSDDKIPTAETEQDFKDFDKKLLPEEEEQQ